MISGLALSTVTLLAGGLVVGCGGKVVFEGVGGGDSIAGNANDASVGANGATSGTGSSNVDLEPICEKFCDAYQACAPQTNCKLGCMSSPVLACKKEYAADVVCITKNLMGCGGFSQACAAEQMAYADCESKH